VTDLAALVLARAQAQPQAVALRKKHLGRWRPYTWEEYARRAQHVGRGLRALGVGPGARVAVVSDPRPAWVFTEVGAQGIGAHVTAISAAANDVAAKLEACTAVVAEDEEQVDKIVAVRARLDGLRHVVVVDPRGVRVLDEPGFCTFGALEAIGAEAPTEAWTGATTDPVAPPDELLAYLPIDTALERTSSLTGALAAGSVVNFGEGELADDLREVQPTRFAGPPAVWEAMRAQVETRMRDATAMKRYAYRRRVFVVRSLRDKLGLARLRHAATDGPLAADTRRFFSDLGIDVVEVAR